MANSNATRSFDGTTVTITLSAEHAERAHTIARYLVAGPLDSYPQPWNKIALFGTKESTSGSPGWSR